MTASTDNATPAAFVTPTEDSRLAQLLAQYDVAKAEADKAAEALKAITDGIKVEAINAAPGGNDIRLDDTTLTAPLRLFTVETTRLDTTRLKKEQPAYYAQLMAAYGKTSTAWQLRRVAS